MDNPVDDALGVPLQLLIHDNLRIQMATTGPDSFRAPAPTVNIRTEGKPGG